MWLFVMFDLPVKTKKEVKAATRFRNNLLKNGFVMMQYSIYIKHCPSYENAVSYSRKVKSFLEEEGEVTLMTITDKQYGDMEVFIRTKKSQKKEKAYMQLELF
ncbi:MAG TPA: CRISPR-associated endonuclease Cas2 [Candidatus Kapabacteria bacterium]|nr:CRISPR-associated endonuclease Cas2 [Candidatus Kapabacteria bacterium]